MDELKRNINGRDNLSCYVILHLFAMQSKPKVNANTMGVTSGTGTAHPSGAPEFRPGFQWGS
jgi:hypothetical protein